MVKAIKKNLRDTDQVILKEELKAMKKVLRRLGFVNREGVVEMKGRVACEINSADELVLTEMIFNGVFNDLAPEQIVALASCFVFQEKVCRTAHTREREPKLIRVCFCGDSVRDCQQVEGRARCSTTPNARYCTSYRQGIYTHTH